MAQQPPETSPAETPQYSVEPPTLPARFQWHHRVHEAWASERLHFWRLGFSPTYDRNGILERLHRALQENAVSSFAMYELTGIHDIIIRLWLPPSSTAQQFEASLRKHLSDKSLFIIDVFIVSQITMHWIWQDGRSRSPREPSSAALSDRLPDAEISLINDRRLPAPRFQDYARLNLVANAEPHPGIKFFILIPEPSYVVPVSAREDLTKGVQNILRSAAGITEVSLYQGHGFAQFLLMGRVSYESFHQLSLNVIDKINSSKIGEYFGVRTYTHISSLEDFASFQEKLPLLSPTGTASVVDYLAGDESAKLEVKGSAFVDLGLWLFSDQQSEHPLPSDRVTTDGVLKAIVGMLNAEGGAVVIGALERARFSREPALTRLKNCPVVGDYVVCGIAADKQGREWDWYQRKLLETINSGISPSPGPWISIERQERDPAELCLLTVRPSTSQWFYLHNDPRFIVRLANTSRELLGVDADNYKRERPRPP